MNGTHVPKGRPIIVPRTSAGFQPGVSGGPPNVSFVSRPVGTPDSAFRLRFKQPNIGRTYGTRIFSCAPCPGNGIAGLLSYVPTGRRSKIFVNAYAPNPSRQGRGIRRPSPSAGIGACFMVLCPLVRRFGGSRNPGKFRETRDWAQALLR